ncbi:hypothetical protein NP493_23g02000 [Ridgeia piscesae]|uniref:Small integral membrane protein 15 n=1 Tax=Ridgeia piscesae TaxID=27915 RepID=A0AAD9PDQ4_RIDPI|nr:hypothetical protein NP493_23g02000 [Ridgeia piscesae]
MVEFADPKGPVKEGIDNAIFIFPAIIVVTLVGVFVYKLVQSLKSKQHLREEKKKLKQQRKEKEIAKKQKRK